MDTEAIIALRLLKEIALGNERLIDLQFEFRSKSGVKTVSHGLDLRKFKDGCLVDGYVEVEISDDQSYCWWLELRIEPTGWTIETSILKDHPGGQDVIEGFADRRGETLDNLSIELASAIEQLIQSARSFVFTLPE